MQKLYSLGIGEVVCVLRTFLVFLSLLYPKVLDCGWHLYYQDCLSLKARLKEWNMHIIFTKEGNIHVLYSPGHCKDLVDKAIRLPK